MACDSAATPDAARRHLHKGDEVAHGDRQGLWVSIRPQLVERPSERVQRDRLFLNALAPCPRNLIQVEAGEPVPVRRREMAYERALDHRAQSETVTRGHQVDGGTHQRDAHRRPAGEQGDEFVGSKALHPGPEAHVWRKRSLGLHADEMFQRVHSRNLSPLQQHLPRKQSTVERAPAQNVHLGHTVIRSAESVR